jgi:hypothetical protein
MLSGWMIVLATLALLAGTGERFGFVVAGLAVEALGLGLLAKSYLLPEPEPESWKLPQSRGAR